MEIPSNICMSGPAAVFVLFRLSLYPILASMFVATMSANVLPVKYYNIPYVIQ